MKHEEVVELVNELGELRAMADVLRLDKQKLIEEAMPEDVNAELASIEAEFSPQQAAVAEHIADAEAKVKRAVVELGLTVTGEHVQAVYVSAKRKWDTKRLDGYAVAHPEIEAFVSQSNPYVTIRNRKR